MAAIGQMARGVLLVGVLCAGFVPVRGEAPAKVTCRLETTEHEVLSAFNRSVIIPHLATPPKLDGVLGPGEWNGAAVIEPFLVPVSTRQGGPETRGWVAVDQTHLYAAFRCTTRPGVTLKLRETQRDSGVCDEDSIEIYICPNFSKPVYYELSVNSSKTRQDVKYTFDPWTGRQDWRGSDPSWNPDWQVATALTEYGWSVEVAIPLAELGIEAKGIRPIRVNFLRNLTSDTPRCTTWTYLPSSNINTPANFGIGVCTFGRQAGEPFSLTKVDNWGRLGLLRTDRECYPVVLPAPAAVTVRAALPDKAFQDSKIVLEANLVSLVAEGTTTKPATLGKFPLTSGKPVKLVLDNLDPGDYRLTLEVRGPGVQLSKEVQLLIRRPRPQPKFEGTPILDHSDWRGSKGVGSAEGVEHALSDALLLKTEFKSPVLAFKPTDDETITCMTAFKGKLYIGSCTEPSETDTGSIFVYEPELDLWEKVFEVNEQGLTEMNVYGDHLYIPGFDANDGGWELGNIYIYDGQTWAERRTVPRAVHLYGLAVYRGKIYVSGSVFDAPPKGKFFHESLVRGLLKASGRILSSADGGRTWQEAYCEKNPDAFVRSMAVIKDKLVANSGDDLLIFDGQTWKRLGLNPAVVYVHSFFADGNLLLMGTPLGLCFFDGERFQRSRLFSDRVWAIDRFGDKRVLLYHASPCGLGGGYPRLDEKAKLFFSSVIAVPPEALYENWQNGGSREKFSRQVTGAASDELCVSCCAFRGRLYLGTHPHGRVLVLPVVSEGHLDSSPQRIEAAGTFRLICDAATPKATSVTLQVRSAPTAAALKDKTFVGPDRTAASVFELPGGEFHVPEPGYLQYRVILKTSNPARSPYVKRILVTPSPH
jgi:hypothetical protein